MEYFKLEELIKEIYNITNIKDIALHKVCNGRLNPIFKTDTTKLAMIAWKKFHSENPVFIKDSVLLEHIISSKKVLYIYDTKRDARSPSEFKHFNIKSVLVLPILKDGQVIAFVQAASLGEYRQLDSDQIDRCTKEISKNFEVIMEVLEGNEYC